MFYKFGDSQKKTVTILFEKKASEDLEADEETFDENNKEDRRSQSLKKQLEMEENSKKITQND